MTTFKQKMEGFAQILSIMDDLREKCPWDKDQTNESLRHLTIEETYELADAIISQDKKEIKKELGDLLFHIIFYAKIGTETADFDIGDILESLAEKLIYRHPHVFSDQKVQGKEEVRQNWEALKLKEKDGNKTILGGLPKSLPPIVKAIRIQHKARGAGFDWDEKIQVWEKVKEEISEFEAEIEANDPEKMENEFGDILFALINAARLYGINPEIALEKTNRKFIARFNYMEQQAKEAKKSLISMSLADMEIYWNEAKVLGL